MNTARDSHTATLLPKGWVLVAGGEELVNNSVVIVALADLQFFTAFGHAKYPSTVSTRRGRSDKWRFARVSICPGGPTVTRKFGALNVSFISPEKTGDYPIFLSGRQI